MLLFPVRGTIWALGPYFILDNGVPFILLITKQRIIRFVDLADIMICVNDGTKCVEMAPYVGFILGVSLVGVLSSVRFGYFSPIIQTLWNFTQIFD